MEHSETQDSSAGFFIFADDEASIGDGKTGLTIAATLSKGGAAANAVAPTITERSDVAPGVYWVAPLAAHRDTLGRMAWGFTATDAKIAPRFEKVVAFNDQVVAPTDESIRTEIDANSTVLAATVQFIDTEIAAIKNVTDGLPEDVATETTLAAIDDLIDAIKEVTDQFRFTIDNQVNANAVTGGGGGSIDANALAAQLAVLLTSTFVRRAGNDGLLSVDREVVRGTTWTITLDEALDAGWTQVDFTARLDGDDDQAESLIHVRKTSGGTDDGLKVWNGSDDVTDTDASISVDGLVATVTVKGSVTSDAPIGKDIVYDAKVTTASDVEQTIRGNLNILPDVTRL